MRYTAKDVADSLARDARGIAQMLLPQGVERSGEWCAGSVNGEAGQSLKVRLTGPHAGEWKDFAEDSDRGDLLDLWAATQGLTLSEAYRSACDYLGLQLPKLNHELRPSIVPVPKGSQSALQSTDVWNWLESRGFSEATIKAFRVGESNGAVLLTAFTPDGRIQYTKFRSLTDKKFWSGKGGAPCLYGWQALSPDARHIVICEGELDCLAWHEYGIPALSPTNGAANAAWIETEHDNLARFDSIYLSFDMDEAGQSHVHEIAERLGQERCRIVELPEKDANDCLLKGYATADMRQILRAAKTMDPQELRDASDLEDEVIAYRNSGQRDEGVRLPFSINGDLFVMRPGELIVLAGVNGSGKTEMADQLTLHAVQSGTRACIGSFEFKPVKLIDRIQRQAGANQDLADAYSRAISRWMHDKVWLFVPNGPANIDRMMEVFEYAVRRYGIRWFVVDNLTKCGIGDEDYDRQKKFAEQLSEFARDHDATVILCAHQRKGADESRPTGKMDVKGSGGITDMADSVMVLWKNKPKIEEREKAQSAQDFGAEPEFDESEKPDGLLQVVKQRNGETEPVFRIWYDFNSHQYVARYGYRPIRYVEWSSANERASA